jgi:hypothetical protein
MGAGVLSRRMVSLPVGLEKYQRLDRRQNLDNFEVESLTPRNI